MVTRIWRVFSRFGAAIALSLAVLGLAACGSSEEPATEAPAAAAESTNESTAATPSGESETSAAVESEPQGDIAPMFTLPSASGDEVSLESFAGDKNVVLVFYRGFW